jgi:hypothetical protein
MGLLAISVSSVTAALQLCHLYLRNAMASIMLQRMCTQSIVLLSVLSPLLFAGWSTLPHLPFVDPVNGTCLCPSLTRLSRNSGCFDLAPLVRISWTYFPATPWVSLRSSSITRFVSLTSKSKPASTNRPLNVWLSTQWKLENGFTWILASCALPGQTIPTPSRDPTVSLRRGTVTPPISSC